MLPSGRTARTVTACGHSTVLTRYTGVVMEGRAGKLWVRKKNSRLERSQKSTREKVAEKPRKGSTIYSQVQVQEIVKIG